MLLLAVQINAYPYEDPIVTDRPGYTSTKQTVRPGMYVVEPGYEYAFNNDRVKQVTLENNIILDGAFQYLLTENVQLDISAGAGLNGASTNYVGS